MASATNGVSYNAQSPHSSATSSPTSPSFSSPVPSTVRRNHGPLRISPPATPVRLEPPPGVLYQDFVHQWTDAHVARWLADNKCGGLAPLFSENDIRGNVILDLDHATLKEMRIVSVGERARIINALKQLRNKCQTSKLRVGATLPTVTVSPSSQHPPMTFADADAGTNSKQLSRRAATGRPPPLTLKPTASRDLPELVHATSTTPRPALVTPVTAHGSAGSSSHLTPISKERILLPPLPPVPRTQPPPPPSTSRASAAPTRNGSLVPPPQAISGRRTPTLPEPIAPPPAFTAQPLPPAPAQTPSTPAWTREGGYGLPGNPAAYRAASPLQPTLRNGVRSIVTGTSHQKSSSLSRVSSSHPYATPGSLLEPPTVRTIDLSPISEAFPGSSANTPSTLGPPGAIKSRPSTPHVPVAPSLEDLRRKTIRVYLGDDGSHYRVVNVHDCENGSEVLERVLKRFGKWAGSAVSDETSEGGLTLDGWAAFYDDSFGEGKPLTEAQLLSVCHADPDDPARELGLKLRRVANRASKADKFFGERVPATGQNGHPGSPTAHATSDEIKKQNRASSISILSGLGVRDPERALLSAGPPASPQPSPVSPSFRNKPSKLRNFFGQRPPSELITTHLAEFFPFTERKVLERTARHSIMRSSTTKTDTRRFSSKARRESAAPWVPTSQSRFSSSTLGSRSRASMEAMPRMSTPPSAERLDGAAPPSPPRMSISTEDGHAMDLSTEDLDSLDIPAENGDSDLHVLPPVSVSTESLSDSFTSQLSNQNAKRLSQLHEMRSKRDVSDTASMLTVDEITQEVESRRASWVPGAADIKDAVDEDRILGEETAGATFIRRPSIGVTPGFIAPQAVPHDEKDGDEEEEEEEDGEGGDNVEPDHEGDAEAHPDDGEPDEEEFLSVTSMGGRRSIKWIRGALIGSGSFGHVYLGMDKVSGLLMAVKQVELPTGLTHNEERKKSMLTALEREIELLKELQHPNIVQYLDSSMDVQFLNIFLEYVPGGSVAALLNNYGAFEEALVKNFVRQILMGLNYLHERDIIHRDIKGANILVDNKGGIKISDFGISKKVADNILSTARVNRPSLQGSVFWMAPEVVKQTSYTRKADIWSLGCLIVEMFTGQHPYPKLNQMQAIFKIGSSAKPAIPSDISADAEEFLGRTFEIDYQSRPSAAELLLHTWTALPVPKTRGNKVAPALNTAAPEVSASA